MSIKIHDGYRVPVAQMGRFVRQANETLYGVYTDLYRDTLIRIADQMIEQAIGDGALLEDTQARPADYQRLSAVVEKKTRQLVQQAATSPYRTLDDISCSYAAVFAPDDDPWAYVIFYPQDTAYRDVWNTLDHLEPWPYWNNSDRPDDVSEDAWDERRDRWDAVLGRQPPAQVGLTYAVTDADVIPVHLLLKEADIAPRLGHDVSYLRRHVPNGWADTQLASTCNR